MGTELRKAGGHTGGHSGFADNKEPRLEDDKEDEKNMLDDDFIGEEEGYENRVPMRKGR